MRKIERSSDNKVCRELSILTKGKWWHLIWYKEKKELEISKDLMKVNKSFLLPQIPIKDLLWLINGSER